MKPLRRHYVLTFCGGPYRLSRCPAADRAAHSAPAGQAAPGSRPCLCRKRRKKPGQSPGHRGGVHPGVCGAVSGAAPLFLGTGGVSVSDSGGHAHRVSGRLQRTALERAEKGAAGSGHLPGGGGHLYECQPGALQSLSVRQRSAAAPMGVLYSGGICAVGLYQLLQLFRRCGRPFRHPCLHCAGRHRLRFVPVSG